MHLRNFSWSLFLIDYLWHLILSWLAVLIINVTLSIIIRHRLPNWTGFRTPDRQVLYPSSSDADKLSLWAVINILLVTGFLSASRRPHMLRFFGLLNAAGQEKSKPFMKKQNLLRYLHLPFPPPTSKVYRHVGHVYPDCPVGSTGVWNLPDWM